MFEYAEVEELPERQGLESLSAEGVAVVNDLPALKNASYQSRRRLVQDNHIHLVGAKVSSHQPEELELLFNWIRGVLKVQGHIHIAKRSELPMCSASEYVGKDHCGANPERLA